jgi:hypothetical protein
VYPKNILIYIQQDATLHGLFYLETALHVSGGTTTHYQERKQLYLQHLVFVTMLLLPAAIVEELKRSSVYSCSFSILYSNIYPTRCNVTQLILSGNCSTCFGLYHHPSSEAQTTVTTVSGICHTVTAICRYRERVGTCRYSCLRS